MPTPEQQNRQHTQPLNIGHFVVLYANDRFLLCGIQKAIVKQKNIRFISDNRVITILSYDRLFIDLFMATFSPWMTFLFLYRSQNMHPVILAINDFDLRTICVDAGLCGNIGDVICFLGISPTVSYQQWPDWNLFIYVC